MEQEQKIGKELESAFDLTIFNLANIELEKHGKIFKKMFNEELCIEERCFNKEPVVYFVAGASGSEKSTFISSLYSKMPEKYQNSDLIVLDNNSYLKNIQKEK